MHGNQQFDAEGVPQVGEGVATNPPETPREVQCGEPPEALSYAKCVIISNIMMFLFLSIATTEEKSDHKDSALTFSLLALGCAGVAIYSGTCCMQKWCSFHFGSDGELPRVDVEMHRGPRYGLVPYEQKV